MSEIRIAIDAMGGDNAPVEAIKGAINYINNDEFNKDKVRIIFVGKSELIQSALLQFKYDTSKIDIFDAREMIAANESPVSGVKNKQNSSIVEGTKLVNENKADVFISAGNTGALMVASTLYVGRIKGVHRPALGALIPNKEGFSLLIDAGANVDAKPQYLLQYAKMGAVYLDEMLGVNNPRVGLINIGEEVEKGNSLVKETYKLLDDSELNFVGNVEAREIPEGKVDILVCDAFVGNVLLKYTEGFAKSMFATIKEEILNSGFKTKLGASLMKSLVPTLKSKMDYTEYGGAPLLGLRGLVVKTHGSADAKAFESTIRQGVNFVKADVTSKLEKKFK
ncbi:MAG: phosphate acyltransferase PlsX [Clostridia bacterium]|jgi:glycerol-3-phosphate acyltransferase PlsX|nr:phosphate acyltransferase PlsX [Clostridia bacterium]